ncbi:hypothetical protein VaNZ11_004827 [Volvox africanus]|uniref:Uncharacterized protein n=1 Tax=Volvox africanus TaxID=51714 RepID=A0ABQ5RX90_9CHLO|nr:hypothetical protein VaNZ11_004827 [Volvox africanus]
MTAWQSSHGGAFRLSFVLLLLIGRCGGLAVRARTPKRKSHTLDDILVANITSADVEHNDVQQFVRKGIAYMEALGIKLSEECERRYGYTFIADQKYHHFRLCKSEAKLSHNGKLTGVSRSQSALAKYRSRFEKQQQGRKDRATVSTTIKSKSTLKSAATAAATAGTGKRRSVLEHLWHHDEAVDRDTSAAASAALGRGDDVVNESINPRDGDPEGWTARQSLSHIDLFELEPELEPDGVDDGGINIRRTRRLQAAGNSSSLMYKILKYVETKKEADGGGDISDVYNDDDSDANADAKAAVMELEDADSSGAAATNATSTSATATAIDAERAAKKEAWLAKRRAAVSNAIEPDVEVPALTAINNTFKSSVDCYLQPSMPRNVGFKDAQLLCLGRNVVLDSCAYYDGQNEDFEVRFPKPKVGALKLGCSIRATLLGERNLTKGYKNRIWWMYAQDNAYDTVRQSCEPGSGHVVEHPVAFVLRDRYTHTLHELEVLSTIFTSLAVVDLPEVREQGIQIVLADQMPHASYRPTYAAISYPYRLRHLAEAPYPPNTCFRTALFINAFTNSIAFNPNQNTSECFSPVMIGVHKWLRNLHKELDPTYLARVHHHASETGGIVRRSIVWTSRRNLEALRLTSGVGMTEWQSARMVPNENEVVTALQSAILRWNSRSCLLARYYEGDQGLEGCRDSNVQFDLVFGEFSDWPYYPDQLMTIYRTGILIGVHGAALTFITSTTSGESALLELAGVGWEETQTGNMLNLFPSLAHNVGAYYEQVRYQGPDIDIKIATNALERAMDEVSRRITANQKHQQREMQQPRFNDQYNFDIMFPNACPTSVPNKLRRYVTNHPVQMNLNASTADNSSSGNSSNSSKSSFEAGGR